MLSSRARKADLRFYAALVAGVTAMFLAVYAYHFATGKTLMWKGDAVSQYYNFFVYEGEWLRQIVADLAAGNGLVIPAFTYDLGYGSDVQTALGGMITDPLNLVSALCPPAYAEGLFCFLIYVRYLLAAVAFCAFCRSRKAPRPAALAASLAYVGTGYVLFWACLRHPNFLNVAIMLPLLFLAADRIFARKSPVPFICALAVTFAFSVYFSYWTCFLFLGYCLIRYFFGPRDRSARDFALLVGRFVVYIVIAFCISAVVSLPMVHALLSMGRVGESASVPLLYSLAYYVSIPLNLGGGTVDIMGQYVGPVLLVAAVLFAGARRFLPRDVFMPTAVGSVACLVLMLIPAFGSFMNGFGYPTDRWLVALGFCFSYALCLVLPVLGCLERRDWVRCGVAVAVVLVLELVGALFDGSLLTLLPCALLIACFALFLVMSRWDNARRQALVTGVLCVCCTLCVCLVNYAHAGGNYGKEFTKGMNAWSKVQASPAAAVAKLGDEGDYRFDYAGKIDKKNRSLVVGERGTDFFTSYYNQAVDDFRQEMEYTDSSNHHAYLGSDSRLASELLIGAKYVVAKKGDATRVPAGYAKIGATKKFDLYQANDPTPLAFTYDSYLDRAAYEALPVQERQEVLLRTCVLGASSKSKPSGAEVSVDAVPQADGQDLAASAKVSTKMKVVPSEGVTFKDGKVVVTKRGATLKIQVPDALDDSEVYLRLSGFDYVGNRPSGKAKKGSSLLRRLRVKMDSLTWSSTKICIVKAQAGKHKADFTYKTKDNTTYGDKHEWCMNLGYFKKAPKTITLTLAYRGTYTFDDLQVISQPVAPLLAQAKVLGRNAIDDVEYGANVVRATVDTGENAKMAFFSLPYSAGWTATVDGAEVPLMRANTGFMAVEVGPGQHAVELRYATPGRSTGALLTVAGLAALAAVVLLGRRRSAQEQEQEPVRGKHARR
ncbi:MAG: YfhO family protein [Coriobacteriia bacterium]|nr:YfhO family protein [Coriobacteriia bacterium]